MRIVIVGGVAGGMSAATRARRMNESAEIVVLEKGDYISFANCGLPYYLGGTIRSEQRLLVTTPQAVQARYAIDVRVRHEVTAIDRSVRQVAVTDLESGQRYTLGYDKLILATGATPIVPPVEHVRAPNVLLLRSMEDTQAVQRWLVEQRPARVAIVGAGFIGLEMAEAMHQRGLVVTVIEKAPHALPPIDAEMAAMVHEALRRHGVELITGAGLAGLRASGERVDAVELEDGRIVETDLVLLSIGVRPNVQLAAQAGLTIGASGAVAVDEVGRTSDPDIYAVGDMAEVVHGVSGTAARVPLAGPANRHGRTAGEHAATGSAAPNGRVMGTAIVKVFDLTVATTGLSERDARRQGLAVQTAYVEGGHHAGYYPGAERMWLKVVYAADSGRVLGAQGVGGQGVDKRIDVIATVMHFGGRVSDLAQLDLAYAPPYGAAKDPVHMAGFVAENQRRDPGSTIDATELDAQVLVDVRTPEEFARGHLPGAINVPLEELRQRAGSLDPSRPTVVYCAVGQRGHVAQRLLRQRGFADVRNLKGGYRLAMAGRL